MDREVSVRTKILRNTVRGWNAYREGRPVLALFFLRAAMRDLQTLITKVEHEVEEQKYGPR